MSETGFAGVYQLDNGYWGYRYAIVINGKRKEAKKLKNELGNPFKTAKQAAKARETVRKAGAEKPMQLSRNKIPYGIIIYAADLEKGTLMK